MSWLDAINPIAHIKAIGSGFKKTFKEGSRFYKRVTKEASRLSDKIDREVWDKILPEGLRGYHRRITNMAIGSTIGGAMGMDPASGALIFGEGADYYQAERNGKDGWLAVRQSMTQHAANAAVVFGAFYAGGAFATSAIIGKGTIGAAAIEGAGIGAGLGAGGAAVQGGNLEEIGDAAWKGGVAGGVAGGIGGALGPAGSMLGGAAKGAVVGAAGSVTNTALNGGNGSEILESGLKGAAVGGVAGAANYGLRDAAGAPAKTGADTVSQSTPAAVTPNPAADAIQSNVNPSGDLASGSQNVTQVVNAPASAGVAEGGWLDKTGAFLKSPGGGQIAGGLVQMAGSGLASAMQKDPAEQEEERRRKQTEAMNLSGIDLTNDFAGKYPTYQVPDLVEQYNTFLRERGY